MSGSRPNAADDEGTRLLGLLRISGLFALALCGWVGAEGLSGLVGGPSVRVPWDAADLDPIHDVEGVLARRPVDPHARARDAVGRATGPDGAAFDRAAAGVERWGRLHATTCLRTGVAALRRAAERDDALARARGESLLRTYMRRTPGDSGQAVLAWLETAGPDDDPRPVFGHLPPAQRVTAAIYLEGKRPDAAWDLVMGPLLAPTTDLAASERAIRCALAAARTRREPGDGELLRQLAARPGFPDALREELEATRRALGANR